MLLNFLRFDPSYFYLLYPFFTFGQIWEIVVIEYLYNYCLKIYSKKLISLPVRNLNSISKTEKLISMHQCGSWVSQIKAKIPLSMWWKNERAILS
jgi:hypothetical protein